MKIKTKNGIPSKGIHFQKGYTLISVMLLLASMTVIATMQFRDQSFKLETQKAVTAGQQMRILNDAIEGYMTAHAGPLRGMIDNDCSGNTTTCSPSKVFCQPLSGTADQCDLNLNQLVAEGYLPNNWVNLNIWGSDYKVVVTRVLKFNAETIGNPMDYNLRAITVTRAPWQDANGKPLLGLLGQAVKSGGADLGMTSGSANNAEGLIRRTYNSTMSGGTLITWSADNSMNPWINGIGQLVARAGFEAMANNSFGGLLRRDGSRMMRNNLDMGSQRVNNTQDVFIKNGGHNVAALAPSWVFKYSWRVDSDGAPIQKPDCRVQSGGWTNRTSLVNPWDPTYTPGSTDTTSGGVNNSYDNGEPRILIVNDYLANMQTLGYYDSGAACPSNLTTSSPAGDSSCPADDPYTAYDPAFRKRAAAAYTFYAEDNGSNWIVHMKYWQNNTTNTASDPTMSQGIASVYCYYDNQAASACNGETGCMNSGNSRGSGSAASANLGQSVTAATSVPYQPVTVSGSNSEPPLGATGIPAGAGDVSVNF